MIRNFITKNITRTQLIIRKSSSQTKTKDKWDLFAGVLVERLPIITQTLSPIEQQYRVHLNQIEFENSLKSDHELRHAKDLRQAELIKKGEIDIDVDSAAKQTAQDMKDLYIEEFKNINLASRITVADEQNKKSINRKLEHTLMLLVSQKIGKENIFLLPQGKHAAGETLRQTAERVLQEHFGDKLNVLFYGNTPCGFYKYKYPLDNRQNAVGAKIFFFRSVLKNGFPDDNKTTFEWLEKSELESKTKPIYYKEISQFLL